MLEKLLKLFAARRTGQNSHGHETNHAHLPVILKSALLLCCLFTGSLHAFAETVPDNEEEVWALTDISGICSSSAARLEKWRDVSQAGQWQASLLSPADLTGELAFLNAPYPARSGVVVRENFLKQFPLGGEAEVMRQKFGAYQAKGSSVKTQRYDYSLTGMLRRFLKAPPPRDSQQNPKPIDYEDVYRFAVDEGCGNVTVFQVGVWSDHEKIYEVKVRRLYDDDDFARRGVPYRFVDFDQEMPYEIERSIHRGALQSLLNQARKNGHADFLFMYNLLRNAGLTAQHLNVEQDVSGRWLDIEFHYVPPYTNFNAGLFDPWAVILSFKGDGYGIEDVFIRGPNCHCTF